LHSISHLLLLPPSPSSSCDYYTFCNANFETISACTFLVEYLWWVLFPKGLRLFHNYDKGSCSKSHYENGMKLIRDIEKGNSAAPPEMCASVSHYKYVISCFLQAHRAAYQTHLQLQLLPRRSLKGSASPHLLCSQRGKLGQLEKLRQSSNSTEGFLICERHWGAECKQGAVSSLPGLCVNRPKML